MKKSVKYLVVITLFCLGNSIFAQDIHFSQFWASPLSLSPSNTGNYNGDWRVMANYRSQWKSVTEPYITNSIGFDKNFFIFSEKISGGILLINDKSAGPFVRNTVTIGGPLQVLKILGSAAYHKSLGGHELHGGIQFGYVRKGFGPPDETYPNQLNWETGHFDKSMPNYETNITGVQSYLDLNVGIGWNKRMNKIEPFVSVAMFHVNFPKETFFGSSNHLKPRMLVCAGTKIFVNDKITLLPKTAWHQTTKANEYLLGSNIDFKLNEGDAKTGPTSVYTGTFFRYGIGNEFDAAYGVIGMIYKRFDVGLSYDLNFSKLKTASNYRGAFEISLIYTGLSTRLTKIEIPCDRY